MRSLPILSRKLVLEDPQKTPDGAGGFLDSWAPLGEHWAEVTASTGGEGSGEALTLASVTYRITVRGAPFGSSSRPRPDQRFRDGARVFMILAVAERDPRGQYLTCFSREETAA